jgi:DNA mismatch repair protein MutL
VLTLTGQQMATVKRYQPQLEMAGIICVIQNKANQKLQLQIRQFPAILRDKDVNTSFIRIIDSLFSTVDSDTTKENSIYECYMIGAIAKAMVATEYSAEQAQTLWLSAKITLPGELIAAVLLNSVPLDLTSEIKQLNAKL